MSGLNFGWSLTCGAQVPQAVVYGGDDGTVLRVADLGKEDRARQLGQGVSETDEESTAKVHYQGFVSLARKSKLQGIASQ